MNQEDREDLQAFEERKDDKTITFDEMLAKLGLTHEDLEKDGSD